ncbi:MAG: alpha-ketoglutarate-dependent dioxygenase AlkB [Paracoccaceae bacterium]|nr:alpha-ketoglutarate-dependent dioxygenase AlkB [Paracoccaceae bacterium]
MSEALNLRGVQVFPGFLDRAAQQEIVNDIREVTRVAPLVRPVTSGGKVMSVRMTAAGQFGWSSSVSGYQYAPRHPNGTNWPDIPESVLQIWAQMAPNARMPECCLVNWYDSDARMGMHQDRDETDFAQPVVSISLGDDGLFRVGSVERGGQTASLWLRSGDVAVMGGDARLVHHGVDRIKAGTSTLLANPGRINLTLRVVT